VGYEWGPQKAAANLRKHKVDFADAVGVFEDPLAITVPDDRHEESRFVTMGIDFSGRLLVVAYTGSFRRARRCPTSAANIRGNAHVTGIRLQQG